ncbi:hypothetical protein IC235_17595 [Hymenobacter sp. BT664]|uniref:Uncharacterized protein n=1 Tax=Hymenobacter montanus TaxID=2771359 RepID=A0A927GKM2_9BACT|nr:hypothetical protein [Hymenobacter montanus]MBD2769707.1 hypothetical protein [Hymenobacter montanus]
MRYPIRINDPKTNLVSWMLKLGALMVLVVASFGCATTRLEPNETIITDSTTKRVVQRMVSVSAPGDSARLRTRIQYDEKTGRFKPVTIYSQAGHTTLAFGLDAFGQVTIQSITAPWTFQVPVTDTQVNHTSTKTVKQTQVVKAPLSRFVKGCIAFTIGVLLLLTIGLYYKLSNPFSFITRFFK